MESTHSNLLDELQTLGGYFGLLQMMQERQREINIAFRTNENRICQLSARVGGRWVNTFAYRHQALYLDGQDLSIQICISLCI